LLSNKVKEQTSKSYLKDTFSLHQSQTSRNASCRNLQTNPNWNQ